MALQKVEVRNDRGMLLTLPLGDYAEGYTLQDIDGLEPVDAELIYSEFAQQDGSEYQASSVGNRFIIMKLGFEPDYVTTNVRDLRRKLYGFFMPKKYIRLRFYEDDGLVVEIGGRVEKNKAPRFTKDPDATISITCEKPDFVDLTPVTVDGDTTPDTTTTDHEYPGSTEAGFLFEMTVDRDISGFTIYNTSEDNVERSMVFTAPIVDGDTIRISTVPGNKFATLTHLGVDSSVLYGVSRASNWLNLIPGDNHLRVLLSGAVIPWSIVYNAKYGGL